MKPVSKILNQDGVSLDSINKFKFVSLNGFILCVKLVKYALQSDMESSNLDLQEIDIAMNMLKIAQLKI